MQDQSPVSTITAPSLVTVIGKDSAEPFPMVDRIWDIFSGKGIRTVFLSVGNSKSVMADLEIAESLGCPIHSVPLNTNEQDQWAEVSTILKERKRESGTPFSVGAEAKWILPKNIRVQPALPWWTNGTIELSGSTVKTQCIGESVSSICGIMKIKDNISRIDILKVDTHLAAPGFERGIIASVLNAGFRPSIMVIYWTHMPDVDLATTVAAGHLQNAGYRLMDKLDRKFVYYFTDDDMYQICSWEVTSCQNPLLNELVRSATALR